MQAECLSSCISARRPSAHFRADCLESPGGWFRAGGDINCTSHRTSTKQLRIPQHPSAMKPPSSSVEQISSPQTIAMNIRTFVPIWLSSSISAITPSAHFRANCLQSPGGWFHAGGHFGGASQILHQTAVCKSDTTKRLPSVEGESHGARPHQVVQEDTANQLRSNRAPTSVRRRRHEPETSTDNV